MRLLFFVIVSFITLFQTVRAQEGSIYSRYGLGDVQFSYSARRLGMGQLGTSVSDEDFIGTINPAGWNMLRLTRVEFGAAFNGSYISNSSQKSFYSGTQFTGFTMAFPASTVYGVGIALGIIPVTNVGYKVSQKGTDPNNPSIGDYQTDYEGSGGLSKVFLGSSYRLPFGLSVGATLDYYFGNVNYTSAISFTNASNLTATYTRTYQPKGLGTTLGMISPDLLKGTSSAFSELRIGASINLVSKINVDTLLTSASTLRTDTVNMSTLNMKIPYRINAGASVLISKKYLVTFDYVFQPWKNYSLNDITSDELRNLMFISAGIEYRPIRELGSTFWDQIILRGGLSYEQTQYFINNTGINQTSLYGGFSFPLSFANTIDVGLQYTFRGTTDNSLLKEDGFKIGFGISLGDIWFLRDEK